MTISILPLNILIVEDHALLADGIRNLLDISLKTVETHRLNLMRKLDAHNAAELSNWARRLGVLEF